MTTFSTEADSLSTMPDVTRRRGLFSRIVQAIDPRALIIYAILLIASLFFLFPMAWMTGTSLKTIDEVGQPQLNLLPAVPQWDNYAKLFNDASFYRAYANSLFVVSVTLVGTVGSIALVAFAFSRLEWKGRNIVFALMMGTLMLPVQATLVPQYVLFYNLGWIRTFNPITIPGFFAGGAALIFLLRQFMLGIPKELDEAADNRRCQSAANLVAHHSAAQPSGDCHHHRVSVRRPVEQSDPAVDLFAARRTVYHADLCGAEEQSARIRRCPGRT